MDQPPGAVFPCRAGPAWGGGSPRFSRLEPAGIRRTRSRRGLFRVGRAPGPGARPEFSATSIVPDGTSIATGHGLAGRTEGLPPESEVFTRAIEPDFAVRGQQRVAVKDDDGPARFSRQALEPLREFNFLRHIESLVEPAQLPERGGLDEDEGPGQPTTHAAEQIPTGQDPAGHAVRGLHGERATAGDGAAGLDDAGHFLEQGTRGLGVGVQEDQPVARGRGGAAIPGTRNLVDGLENDASARGGCDPGGGIGGIVVTDDGFPVPAAREEGRRGLLDGLQGSAQQALFVERGDDNADTHRRRV